MGVERYNIIALSRSHSAPLSLSFYRKFCTCTCRALTLLTQCLCHLSRCLCHSLSLSRSLYLSGTPSRIPVPVNDDCKSKPARSSHSVDCYRLLASSCLRKERTHEDLQLRKRGRWREANVCKIGSLPLLTPLLSFSLAKIPSSILIFPFVSCSFRCCCFH